MHVSRAHAVFMLILRANHTILNSRKGSPIINDLCPPTFDTLLCQALMQGRRRPSVRTSSRIDPQFMDSRLPPPRWR